MENLILECRDINKSFYDPVEINVLKHISFKVNQGEFISIVGKSGCGKSTLLYIISTMDTDYQGDLLINNQLLTHQDETTLANIRNQKIGFVFQFHYLINEFSVLRNVMLPALKLAKFSKQEIEFRAMEKLKLVGVDHLASKKANLLSGGEKQRVAIARALINDPAIIMGDEPTGNLDSKNAQLVFEIFKELAESFHQTLLIVTHNQTFADNSGRIIEIDDGRIVN
ncbi:ABC transporter ATP-binding protein [Pedobacter nyackensis]|uniref:ABC transporter ATP-binding protein n=1 Tax=Pedobacter nyackensis TaxID=475255 RepID=UPI00292EE6CC|nr:ABC transporter ATP-binding protein [Pedobacter nyackensis]